MKSGDVNQFKQLSQFKDLKDFNNHFEQHMVDLKAKFTKGELIALKRLVRFSASIVGVCYAKIGTIVAATYEHDGAGISRSTFKRMLSKAKELGLITIYETTMKNGKQGHNVYVFNQYQSTGSSLSGQAEPPKQEQLNQPKTSNLLETNKILNKRYSVLDTQFASDRVPKEFAELVSCFYHSADTIEELWKCVTVSTYHLSYDAETVLEMALNAFRQLIRLVKKNKVRKSIYAVYWGIVNRKLDELYFEDLYESGFAV